MKDFLSRLVAPVLVAFLAAGMAQGAFYQWSRTASSNGIVDPSINWAEGMSPSSYNDSARAMMARLAEWRDDNSGQLTTGGTSTAYTVTTFEGLTATPSDGTTLVVTFHAANGASATLQADGGTAFAIINASGVSAPSGTLAATSAYRLRFNASIPAWVLQGYYNNAGPPIGTIVAFAGYTPPTGYVMTDGGCYSRTTYAALFAAISTNYGAGNGTTTFCVPDLRARMLVAYDPSNATGRMSNANLLANVGGAQSHAMTIGEMPTHDHGAASNVIDPGHAHTIGLQQLIGVGGGGNSYATGSSGGNSFPGTDIAFTGISVSTTVGFTGGGAAMSLMNPYQVVNYIIRIQ